MSDKLAKHHVCWTDYDEREGLFRGIHHDDGRYIVMKCSLSASPAHTVRTYEVARSICALNGYQLVDAEGFVYYRDVSESAWKLELWHGVYVASGLTHHHTDHVRCAIFLSVRWSSLRRILTRLFKNVSRDKITFARKTCEPLVYATHNGGHEASTMVWRVFVEFADVPAYLAVMTHYFNYCYDYQPHSIKLLVTPAMQAAQIANVRFSQLPSREGLMRNLPETILSWDIECLSFSPAARMPQPKRAEDCVELIVATIYKDTTPVKSVALLYVRNPSHPH